MDEIKTDATNESVENQEVVTDQSTETAETTDGKAKKKVKLQAETNYLQHCLYF